MFMSRCTVLRIHTRNLRCHAWSLRNQSTAASPTSAILPALLSRARSLADEHARLSKQLYGQYDAQLAKKAGSLSAVTTALKEWESANSSLSELQQLSSSPDPELRSLAAEELASTTSKLSSLSNDLSTSLIPQHPFANFPCLIELRPGAGGDEAALFAGDLLRMYQAFCRRHGLRVNVVKVDSAISTGGEDQIQEAILEIETADAYSIFRCEAGVHRVQRVPATETKGRTHTSAVSVLVLPSFPDQGLEELGFDDPASDYFVDPKDVRTDVMRARGAGGQHVNTTESAVRLTHTPTNTVVTMQDFRSQHQNRRKAWSILRSRIAQARREAREEEMAQLRLSLVGVARTGRGDKVRTYNWNQQRVTDHRSGISLHDLYDVLEGGESLDEVMASVKEWLKTKDVEALAADEEAASLMEENSGKKQVA